MESQLVAMSCVALKRVLTQFNLAFSEHCSLLKNDCSSQQIVHSTESPRDVFLNPPFFPCLLRASLNANVPVLLLAHLTHKIHSLPFVTDKVLPQSNLSFFNANPTPPGFVRSSNLTSNSTNFPLKAALILWTPLCYCPIMLIDMQ